MNDIVVGGARAALNLEVLGSPSGASGTMGGAMPFNEDHLGRILS